MWQLRAVGNLPSRDCGRSGILRLHLDHRLLPALTRRVLGHQEDRAGGQATPPPGRIEAVRDIHLAGSQTLSCEPQADRPCECLAGARPDAESAEWPGITQSKVAKCGARTGQLADRDATRRRGRGPQVTAVEPAFGGPGPAGRRVLPDEPDTAAARFAVRDCDSAILDVPPPQAQAFAGGGESGRVLPGVLR